MFSRAGPFSLTHICRVTYTYRWPTAGPFIWHPSAIAWLNRLLRSGSSQLYSSTRQMQSHGIKVTYTGQLCIFQTNISSHLNRSAWQIHKTGQRIGHRHLIQPPQQVGLADSFTHRTINRTHQLTTIRICTSTISQQFSSHTIRLFNNSHNYKYATIHTITNM